MYISFALGLIANAKQMKRLVKYRLYSFTTSVMDFKAHTHRPTFAESALNSALESADSNPESDDSSANTPVGM